MKIKTLLKWTKEMERLKDKLICCSNNKEDWNDNIKPALYMGEQIRKGKFYFWFNIPLCVAGSSTPLNSYKIIDNPELLINAMKERGHKLIAWYGWGGCGEIIQTTKFGGK